MFGAPMVKIPGAHWCLGGLCHPQHHPLSGLSVAHGAPCPFVTRALAAEPGREGRGSYQAYSVQYRQPHGRAIRRPKKTPHAELCGPGRPRHIRSIARRAQDPRGAPRRRQTRRLRCPNHATHILKMSGRLRRPRRGGAASGCPLLIGAGGGAEPGSHL